MPESFDFTTKNLEIQRKNEDDLYDQSIRFLREDEAGKQYLELFELIGRTCISSTMQKSVTEEDELTVAFIGARLFRNGLVAYRSALTGYYQTAMALVRDLIEVQFLLDYFKSNQEKIEEWRNATNQERYRQFGPHQLYRLLDERDGFTEEKRKKTYQRYCEYAAHVSFPGMQLLTDSEGVITLNPSFDSKKLLNTMIDIDRTFGHAVLTMTTIISATELTAMRNQLELMEQFSEFAGLAVSSTERYRKLKAMVDGLVQRNHS